MSSPSILRLLARPGLPAIAGWAASPSTILATTHIPLPPSSCRRPASSVSPLLEGLLFGRSARPRFAGASYMSNLAASYKEKYRNKLENKAKEQGYGSVDELIEAQRRKRLEEAKAKHQAQVSNGRHDVSSSGAALSAKGQAGAGAETIAASQPAQRPKTNNLPPHVKTLDQILCLEKISNDMSAKDISDLWNQYHATKDCISAAIPADTYKLLQIKAKTHPMFILPLPHTEGIEFYILQFDYHQVHFTSLLEYKSNLSSARPHLSLIHYTDLADSKGIVLMRGEISSDPRMLTPQQAQFLALQMQQFYVTGGQEKQKLLETFTFHPQNFNYEQLIEAANKLD